MHPSSFSDSWDFLDYLKHSSVGLPARNLQAFFSFAIGSCWSRARGSNMTFDRIAKMVCIVQPIHSPLAQVETADTPCTWTFHNWFCFASLLGEQRSPAAWFPPRPFSLSAAFFGSRDWSSLRISSPSARPFLARGWYAASSRSVCGRTSRLSRLAVCRSGKVYESSLISLIAAASYAFASADGRARRICGPWCHPSSTCAHSANTFWFLWFFHRSILVHYLGAPPILFLFILFHRLPPSWKSIHWAARRST